MANFKVIFDRENCIGAAACAAMDPSHWEIDHKDGKANLKGSTQTQDNVFEASFDEKDLETVKRVAKECPAVVIHIYDEAGNKIF